MTWVVEYYQDERGRYPVAAPWLNHNSQGACILAGAAL